MQSTKSTIRFFFCTPESAGETYTYSIDGAVTVIHFTCKIARNGFNASTVGAIFKN